jgi:DNA-binding transcriptional LysR family regulator
MRLDLVSLRIFLSIVEEGNLTKAAEREHIAASAVSKRIQDLEHGFGVRLLNRSIRGVVPTAAGEALARRARSLFGVVNQIRGELSGFAAGRLGEVVMHANGSAIAEFLAADLRSFLEANPGVKVELHEELSPEIVRAVNQGLADIGIFADTIEVPEGLTVYSYRTDRLLAVVPAGHPLASRPSIAFAELLEFEQIGVAEGSSLAQLLRTAARELDRPIRFNCTVSTNEVVRWMVDAGFGVAILPEGFVLPYERILRIRGVSLEDPWAHRQLSIAVRDPQNLTKAARNLLEWLRQPISSGDRHHRAASEENLIESWAASDSTELQERG